MATELKTASAVDAVLDKIIAAAAAEVAAEKAKRDGVPGVSQPIANAAPPHAAYFEEVARQAVEGGLAELRVAAAADVAAAIAPKKK